MENNSNQKNPIDIDKQLDDSSKKIRDSVQNKNKKSILDYDLSWIIIIILGLYVFGISYTFQLSKGAITVTGLIIVFVLAALFIGIIFYTLGRIIFGSITGYSVKQLVFLGFNVVKTSKGFKTNWEFSRLLEMRLLLTPKDDKDHNPTLMFLGGTISYVIFAAIVLVLSFVLTNLPTQWKYILQYGILVSLAVPIYELIPLNYTVKNDALMLILTRSSEDKKAYNNYLINKGNDITNDFLTPISFTNYENSRVKYWTLLADIEKDIYDQNYNKAYTKISTLLEKEASIPSAIYCEAGYNKIFLLLITNRSKEASEYITTLEKKVKNSEDYHLSISAYRSDILVSAFIENSLESTKDSIESFQKLALKYPLTPRVTKEVEIVNNNIPRINQAHPDWKLNLIDLSKFEKNNSKEED